MRRTKGHRQATNRDEIVQMGLDSGTVMSVRSGCGGELADGRSRAVDSAWREDKVSNRRDRR